MKKVINDLNMLIQEINETVLFINNNFTEDVDSIFGNFKELEKRTSNIIGSLSLLKDSLKKEILNLEIEHTNYPQYLEKIINQIDDRLSVVNKVDFIHGLSSFKSEVLIISADLMEESKLDYSIRNYIFL